MPSQRPLNDQWLAYVVLAANFLVLLPRALASSIAPRLNIIRPSKVYQRARVWAHSTAWRMYWWTADVALKSSPASRKTKNAKAEKSVNGEKMCPYAYIEPAPGASRSPCPALNTMANHGYIPRDGRSLTAPQLIDALKACYNLSTPLACALTYGALLRLGASPFKVNSSETKIDLHDLAQAGVVEHDASLVHARAPKSGSSKKTKTKTYAPVEVDSELFDSLMRDADPTSGCMDPAAFARARVRREAEEGNTLAAIQRVVALGESALLLQLFGSSPAQSSVPSSATSTTSTSDSDSTLNWDSDSTIASSPITSTSTGSLHVPLPALHSILLHERLPPNWTPPRGAQRTSLRGTLRYALAIGFEVVRVRLQMWLLNKKEREILMKAEKREERACIEVGESQITLEEKQVEKQEQEIEYTYTPATTPALTPTSAKFSSSSSSSDSDDNSEADAFDSVFERGVEHPLEIHHHHPVHGKTWPPPSLPSFPLRSLTELVEARKDQQRLQQPVVIVNA